MPGLESDVDEFLEPIIRILSASLKTTIEAQLVRAYIQGDKELVFWGMTKGGIPIAYEGPPIKQAVDWAKDYCAKLVTKMDDETKTRLAQVVSDAIQNKRGIPGLAKNIRDEFENMSKFRSQMIARTETCNALEQSFLTRAADMGIEGKEWVTFDPCDICAANGDEGVVPLDHTFSSGDDAPPAHPNAVFEGSTFAPYGSLDQIIRSKYGGPARTIETERVTFTIGPNHPVLTWRGWIPASEINEGDYLLYDLRIDNPSIITVESNLNKMPMIEDFFDSLRSTFGDSTIAGAGTYFHGDEVFTYSEIQVISPHWDLLPVLNPFGIEHLCKCQLSGAYPDKIHVAGCRSCRQSFNRVFSATPRLVSSGNLVSSLGRSHILPSLFERLRVIGIHDTFFLGWAFDASTQYGLYNSSGIIVKNCRCALAPARIE